MDRKPIDLCNLRKKNAIVLKEKFRVTLARIFPLFLKFFISIFKGYQAIELEKLIVV